MVLEKNPHLDPPQIEVLKEESGRPYIPLKDQTLQVGISHSRDTILVAISDQQIGIDLESVQRETDDRLRNRILDPKERNELKSVETIRLWTIKEAVLKLRGTGLRFAMNNVVLIRKSEDQFETKIQNDSILIHSHQIDDFWVAVATHN
ncbi:MAG: 4'-phosphopantetheinyl transferase family protein [Bacteroidota bacterium]